MNIECKKTNNCFADSQTYEYRLPVTVEEFAACLEGWQLRRNERLRRPVLIGERGRVKAKGVLSGDLLRVSYPDDRWEAEKEAFEAWLEGLHV